MVTRTRKPALLNSSGLKSVFEKLCFWRNSVDGRPNRRKKAAFLNFSIKTLIMQQATLLFSGLVRNNFDCLNLGVHSFTNNIGAVTSYRFPCSGRRYHSDNRWSPHTVHLIFYMRSIIISLSTNTPLCTRALFRDEILCLVFNAYSMKHADE